MTGALIQEETADADNPDKAEQQDTDAAGAKEQRVQSDLLRQLLQQERNNNTGGDGQSYHSYHPSSADAYAANFNALYGGHQDSGHSIFG